MTMRLWKIFGGLKLPGFKSMSMTQQTEAAPLPKILTLPLKQHIGHAAETIVNVGDKVLKGQMIAAAKDYVSTPIHASSSGTVIAIEEYAVPHPSGKMTECIVIETDGKDKWIECVKNANFRQLDASALRNLIRDAGIVGLGGAGFPSFIKLNPGPGNMVNTLILNGAECEPYITCDAMLMQEQSRKIIDGLNIMRHALQVERCIIAVEDNKRSAYTMLVNALQEHEAEYIDIVLIPTLYPAGGEKQLIKTLTGKEVPSNGLPINIGIVCHNVATAAAVASAVLEGKPLINRYVTVTGEGVEHPRNLDVLIGTPFSELIELCGKNRKAEQFIMGGPMMGFEISDINIPVIKTTNCILVQSKKTEPDFVMPCIRCGQCASVCPAQLLPQQLYWYARAKNFDKTQDYNLFDCIECGCCTYVCPSHIPLVQYYRFAKTEIWAQEQEKKSSDIARQRHEFRQFRMERKKAENEARKKQKKELLKKVSGTKDNADDAKKAAIEAAMARVKAKREKQSITPANTDNLTEKQKKEIAEVEARRRNAKEEN
ncbi:MAG: electron transport complex subunit RsxC [Gammaproteobacteria bacterium]|nr:electron transport complex subunit RsxC [Gammaproteobacteria bacterium]